MEALKHVDKRVPYIFTNVRLMLTEKLEMQKDPILTQVNITLALL